MSDNHETNFQRYLSTPERAAILMATHLLHPPGKLPSCECNNGCIECWLAWLNSPAEEE